jgi:hypothetical protein
MRLNRSILGICVLLTTCLSISQARAYGTANQSPASALLTVAPKFNFAPTQVRASGCGSGSLQAAFEVGFDAAKGGIRPSHSFVAGNPAPEVQAKISPFVPQSMGCSADRLKSLVSSATPAAKVISCCQAGQRDAQAQMHAYMDSRKKNGVPATNGCEIAYEEGKEAGARSGVCMSKYPDYLFLGCFMAGKIHAEEQLKNSPTLASGVTSADVTDSYLNLAQLKPSGESPFGGSGGKADRSLASVTTGAK